MRHLFDFDETIYHKLVCAIESGMYHAVICTTQSVGGMHVKWYEPLYVHTNGSDMQLQWYVPCKVLCITQIGMFPNMVCAMDKDYYAKQSWYASVKWYVNFSTTTHIQ